MSICHRTVNHKEIWNAPLDALMCLLQIINDIETLSLIIHGVNACFIHHPSNVKNYLIGHKSETSQPKKKKRLSWRTLSWRTYFYTFLQIFGSKFKIPIATENREPYRWPHIDDVGMMETMGTTWDDVGTTQGQCRDNVGTTGTMKSLKMQKLLNKSR